MAGVEFFAQAVGSAPQSGEGFDFVAVELGTELMAALPEHGKARAGDVFEMLDLRVERRQRVVDARAERSDLPLACFAELIEPVEPGYELFDLRLRGVAGVADLAGDIARGVGNDRQMAAEPVHVLERRRADAADSLDLLAVVADQALQRVGVLGNSLAGHAAEGFEIARLGGNELAGQAELAVDYGQAMLEPGAFLRQGPRDIAEAGRLAPRMAKGQQP